MERLSNSCNWQWRKVGTLERRLSSSSRPTSNLEIRSLDNKTKISVANDSITINRDSSKIILDDEGMTLSKSDNSQISINSSEIHLQVGSNGIIINASGIELTSSGNLTIDSSAYLSHKHTGVTTGGSTTGGVSS